MAPHDSDVNFLPVAIATLETIQMRQGKSWEPILDLLREMRDANLPSQPHLDLDLDLLPPIDHYLSAHDHHNIVQDALWTISSDLVNVADEAPVLLRTMSLVYELYSSRTMANFLVNHILAHPVERAQDFAVYMRPMNRVANILFGWRGTHRFYALYPYIPQFTTRQLTAITLHRL
ncbi:unnamed protein product [Peniophora sp. CBMAI 1063]|nr:unnamed protein product [Peniophora sp. CBMAI 1063]